MQRRGMLLALLCATALLASAAWSIDLPVPNGSFEQYTMSAGYYGGTYPTPDYWIGWAPFIQSVECAGAVDGDRVLQVDTTDGYAYAWGPYLQNGIPFQELPDSVLRLLEDIVLSLPYFLVQCLEIQKIVKKFTIK